VVDSLVRSSVRRMAHNAIEVFGDRADVLGNAPLVIIEDGNEAFGGGLDVVQCLIGNAVGEGRVAESAVPAWPAPKQS
jgi:hypothetical protein